MKKALLLGTFDAENYWRDEKLSQMPAIPDKSANNIVAAMDELLFPFCKDGSIFITRYKMNPSFKDYLESLGFLFQCQQISLYNNFGSTDSKDDKNIFQILLDTDAGTLKELSGPDIQLEPYAVLPQTRQFCQKYGIEYNFPDTEIVKKVNSKAYSTGICDQVGIKKYGEVINSAQDILKAGSEFLEQRGFLIKDLYGVSGRGNLHITSQGMLQRVAKFVMTQEEKGMDTCFIIEPFLDKDVDFSCQFNIDKQGKFTLVSVQKMENNNFAYLGSSTAEQDFIGFLDENNYFNVVQKISDQLYGEGYFGDVCIDSMILKSGEIVPVVEINARKSMGFINHSLDQHLSKLNLKGNLTFLSVGYTSEIEYEEILNKMQREEILFTPDSTRGILPLSSNTLFINRILDDKKDGQKTYKGRVYFNAVAKEKEDRFMLVQEMRKFLTSLSFKIYN